MKDEQAQEDASTESHSESVSEVNQSTEAPKKFNKKQMNQLKRDLHYDDLVYLINKTEKEIALLNRHKLIRVYNSYHKLLVFQVLKGMAFGFGSVIGATIVVSFVAYLLSQIEFVPIVGEYVVHILEEIEDSPHAYSSPQPSTLPTDLPIESLPSVIPTEQLSPQP